MKPPPITPGEWENRQGTIQAKERPWGIVAGVVNPANARAIAALPKLLETLEHQYILACESLSPERGEIKAALLAAGYTE